jgi:hypothetical protein
MTQKHLYVLSVAGCVAGYVWIALTELHITRNIWSGCLFRQCFGIPCPACGSTRSILRLLHGDFAGALQLNPLGFLLAFLLIIIPVWLLADYFTRRTSYYAFYQRVNHWLSNKRILGAILFLITLNWVWSLTKAF